MFRILPIGWADPSQLKEPVKQDVGVAMGVQALGMMVVLSGLLDGLASNAVPHSVVRDNSWSLKHGNLDVRD